VFSGAIWYWAWRAMPETLPVEARQPFRPGPLLRGYVEVMRSVPFLSLGIALGAAFSGLFLYVVSAPVFLVRHLGVSETGFLWLFGPITAGLFLGMQISTRMAGRWTPLQTVWRACAILLGAAMLNVVYHLCFPPMLPWSVVPVFCYIVGSSLAMPSVTLMALDLFPKRRGMASSCQSFLQSWSNVLVTGVLAPVLWGSTRTLAAGQLGFALLATGSMALYVGLTRRSRRALAPVA
jgi:DHA1 family bicyclomycin/chloramphenicol resistance-like MFS transporter